VRSDDNHKRRPAEHPALLLRARRAAPDPHIGRIRLGDLTGRDMAAMVAALSTTGNRVAARRHREVHPSVAVRLHDKPPRLADL
jgi:hypothetical protein